MSESFLPVFDITNYAEESQGLNLKTLSYFRRIHAVLTPQTLERAFEFLQSTFGIFDTSFDVTGLDSLDDVLSLLDSGAWTVFVTKQQLAELRKADNVDRSRLVLSLPAGTNDLIRSALQYTDTAIHMVAVNDASYLEEHMGNMKGSEHIIFATLAHPENHTVLRVAKCSVIPVVPATSLSVDQQAQPSGINAPDLLLANAVSDRPDELLTTLVTDERGIALGLVYSSPESVLQSLRTGRGVYQSRKRGLWYKGESSGDTQELVSIGFDCDHDCLRFTVKQKGRGFCHLATATCFGQYIGLSRLQQVLRSRKASAPEGSYTARLFNDPKLLRAKIMEEAQELCEATSSSQVAFEAADLMYFAMTKCIAADVSLEDVERNLDRKSLKVKRRKGDAKSQWIDGASAAGENRAVLAADEAKTPREADAADQASQKRPSDSQSRATPPGPANDRIQMTRYITSSAAPETIREALQRPSQRSTEKIMAIVKPIIDGVREGGDKALLDYTQKFDKATGLKSPVLCAPFPSNLMQLAQETIDAIDVSFENIRRFHAAQQDKPLEVETMPGVVCSRFSRPIERVGLYVPGGTAVLPSTALMLGVPAMVAGCKKIVFASPPRPDGSITPEIVYVAHKVGAESIVLAGGAQAVAALAYGTESVTKVDKIIGPGNQFVTAAKMLVSNDTNAGVSIDMPAGPSEVLVVADGTSIPAFVASDLLSQAEHGVDSQVILIAVDMSESQVVAVEEELHAQASALPRVDIVRGAINHSVTLVAKDINEAMTLSNQYAPEHLILQCQDPEHAATLVENAGSVFIGPWTPESVGDYSAGVNHSLPTYGYARQYSGVNLATYIKHITSSRLSSQGLRNVGPAVMQLAKVEELEAHRRAISIRLDRMDADGNVTQK